MGKLIKVLNFILLAILLNSCINNLKPDVVDRGCYKLVYLSDTNVCPAEVKQIFIQVGKNKYSIFEVLSKKSREIKNVTDYEGLMQNSLRLDLINKIGELCLLSKADQTMIIGDILSLNRNYLSIYNRDQLMEALYKDFGSTFEMKEIQNINFDDKWNLIYIRNTSLISFQPTWSADGAITKINLQLHYLRDLGISQVQ
jgi:hypothetical protein